MILLRITLVVIGLCSIAAAVDVIDKGTGMSESEQLNPDSLLTEADSLFQAREYDSARELYRRTAELARSDFNRPVEIEALSQLARVYLTQGDPDQGQVYLREAAEKASDSDPMGWSRYLGVRGRFEWKSDDLAAARKTFDDMYIYCNTNALWGRAVDAAHMIAIVAETTEEQVEWGLRGIEAAESGGAESWLGPLWNNLAATYYEDNQFDKALEAFMKARDYHWQFSDEVAKLFADYHVGMAYRAAGQPEKAARWLRPVLAWAERLELHSAIGQACEDLGEIALAEGRRDEGLALLKRARDEYKAAGFDQSWRRVWDGINARIAAVEKQ